MLGILDVLFYNTLFNFIWHGVYIIHVDELRNMFRYLLMFNGLIIYIVVVCELITAQN